MSKVNLYIEDKEIKLLVSSGNRVEKWASLMLDEGLVNQGLILQEDKVGEAIKQLFQMQKVSPTGITLGLSGLNSIFRVVSIPSVSRSLLPEAVGNEAARVLPVPLNQVYYSYQILSAPKGEMRIFLAAYPRQTTDTLIETAIKAGLRPKTFDLAPLALARCVNLPQAIIVNSWLTFLDIVILSERIPQVIRSVSLPVESASLQDRLPAIVEEINRTVTFYNASNSGAKLGKSVPLVVSGDLARQEQSWKALERLGYTVQPFKPAMEYKPAFDPTQYAVNCGLALKGRGSASDNTSLIDLNAIPESYQTPPFSWGRVLAPVGLVVALGALGWGYMMVQDIRTDKADLDSQRASLQAEIVRQRNENNTLKQSIKDEQAAATVFPPRLSVLEAQVTQLQTQEDFFNNLAVSYRDALKDNNLDLRELITLAPASIVLENVRTQPGGYLVTGRAPDETAVLQYSRALKEGGRFTTVLISSMVVSPGEETGSTVLEFELSLK